MMNKKNLTRCAAFMGAAICLALVSCAGNDKKRGADTIVETTEIETVKEAAPSKTVMPYSAEFFNNAANKATSTSAADSTYVETPSGLKYAIIKEGTGKSPKATDMVKVNYAGQLTDIDATEFDSSYARNEPAVFPLNRVIPGWTEGVQLMKEGSVYEFYIPAELAYGPQGSGPVPPNAPLIFQVELIEVQGADAAE